MNQKKIIYVSTLVIQTILTTHLLEAKQLTVIAPFAIERGEAYFMVKVDEAAVEPTISLYNFEQKDLSSIGKNTIAKAEELFPKLNSQQIRFISVSDIKKEAGIFGASETNYYILLIKFETLQDLILFATEYPSFKIFSFDNIYNPHKMVPIKHLTTLETLEILKLDRLKQVLADQISSSSNAVLYRQLGNLNKNLKNLLDHINALPKPRR